MGYERRRCQQGEVALRRLPKITTHTHTHTELNMLNKRPQVQEDFVLTLVENVPTDRDVTTFKSLKKTAGGFEKTVRRDTL